MRNLTLFLFCACASVLAVAQGQPLAQTSAQNPQAAAAQTPKRPGVTTPGVRIPITKLKPEAVWRIDPKRVLATLAE